MIRLILVRHGQTDYNLENRYCGFSNPPLNEKGLWQAKRLAERLRGLKIDKVYTSDLQRARQTAELIGAAVSRMVSDGSTAAVSGIGAVSSGAGAPAGSS